MTTEGDDIFFCLNGGRTGKWGSRERRKKRRELDKSELAALLRREVGTKRYQQNLRPGTNRSC